MAIIKKAFSTCLCVWEEGRGEGGGEGEVSTLASVPAAYKDLSCEIRGTKDLSCEIRTQMEEV